MEINKQKFYLLAFASGACGLAYEILYIRLLSIYVGDVYYVAITVLAAVFFGLALGYWFSGRWARYLYVVELCLATVAILYGLIHLLAGPVKILPLMAPFATIHTVIGGLLIVTPMVLVGASIPMLDRFARVYGVQFSGLYRWYNLGAAAFIVLIEVLVLQYMGLGQAIICCSFINFVLAYYFFGLQKSVSLKKDTAVLLSNLKDKNLLVILFIISLISSLWYVYAIELSMRVFGPGAATISFVIACAVVAISVSCLLLERCDRSILYSALGILIALIYALMGPLLDGYSLVLRYFEIAERSWGHVFVQLGWMVVLLLPVFVLFGSTIPAWIQDGKHKVRVVLTVTALGNMLGIVVGYLVLYQQLIHWVPVIVVVATATYLSWHFAAQGSGNKIRTVASLTAVLLLVAVAWWWPYVYMVQGSKYFFDNPAARHAITEIDAYREYGNDAMVLHHGTNSRSVIHLGYQTLTFDNAGQITKREGALGTVGSLYHLDNSERALFVGLGTGASVGAASHVYDQVRVYEINPAMVKLAQDFGEDFGLFNSPVANTEIIINDGIVGIAQEPLNSYDMVANITTLPYFYSANKIHAKEFMQLAKRVLKPDGVYVGWFDVNSGMNGIRIYNDTLLSVFKDCHYYFLNVGYFAYVCGDKLSEPEPVAPLSARDATVQSILEHMQHLRFDLTTSPSGQINSINYPRLILWNELGKNNPETEAFINFVEKVVRQRYLNLAENERRQFCQAVKWFNLYSLKGRCQPYINQP